MTGRIDSSLVAGSLIVCVVAAVALILPARQTSVASPTEVLRRI